MMTQRPDAYDGVSTVYPPDTENRHKFGGEDMLRFITYIFSIVLPRRLQRMLAWGFQHIDGGVDFGDDGAPVVSKLTLTTGKRKFIREFRARVVGRQSVPNGTIEAAMIPVPAAQRLHDLVERRLFKDCGVHIRGKLVAAGVVYFPNLLRRGGDPLVVPPHLWDDGELASAMYPHSDDTMNAFTIRAIQLVYGRRTILGQWRVSGRVGLAVMDTSVPGAIHRELSARREGRPFPYPTAEDVAQWFVRWSAKKTA